MKTGLLHAIAISAALLGATAAQAHRQWMLPSSTVLSGQSGWVTVDAAVSNDLFYFEHQPLRLGNVKTWAPDGSEVALQNPATGRYRSTFDVELKQQGTYKIVNAGGGIFGSYKENGTEKRLPRGVSAADIEKLIPAGATDVKLSESLSRNEVFVTLGAPTDTVLKPSGKGLELVPVTHPNDLVSGEAATFQFVIDGKPAAGIEIEVVPGGIRYRDQLGQMDMKTDAEGKVTITWPNPGLYWMSAEASDKNVSVKGAEQRRLGYVSTLEVLAP
ncbi:DUF4198 domain-containing protein [Sphingosinicella soli]|uniref:Putative GH25 family protein n=1 Tax=Sphingosinicella soli TaxID=333708 RepID=A0A7W7B4V4_9SPHN|nr:DUF4198 domain-containing protein [Sphingosinicella soli]MBB4633183.1 putative GH25 family protein [Sphingosinicella soli]